MGTRAIPFVVCFIILFISFFFFSSMDIRSGWSVLNPAYCNGLVPTSPLHVYMYDLPRRFNFEMIDHGKAGSSSLPPWPRNSGLRKQHSVEYWMMGSLMYQGDGENMDAIRVFDPEMADVFFVPFFSSLSFNIHGHNMTDPETEVDRKLQFEVLNFLHQSNYWQRYGGSDHVIPIHHPNAFRFLRDRVNASILIVADFGRLPKEMSNLRKDVVAPYVHVVDSFLDDNSTTPFESRPILLFFRGRTVRKDEGVVRTKLGKILAGINDVHYEKSVASADGIRESMQGMRMSKFCLHPAGDTPSSCRLFDAIVSHCVPVIVSDRIELPYESELDYQSFSLFFSMREALQPNYMINQLRQIPKQKWLSMWARLKNVSHHFEFQYPPKKEDAVNMLWRQVRYKLPAIKLAAHRSRRLTIPDWWRSKW